MRNRYIKWDRLDNTANLFPVIAGERLTNTYRISAILKEEINPELLQQAVDIVTPKIPGFNLRLRKGFFWYYFEENGKKAPIVREEDSYPCRFIHASRNRSYLFRVTYYENRINVEAFHVLTDGMGIIAFLKEIVYQYLRLSHPELSDKFSDNLSSETSLNREDSFVANYKSSKKSIYKVKKAFLIKGERLPHDAFGVMHGYIDINELKSITKEKYGISINEYIIACFIYAAYMENRGRVSKERPLRVAVPVNLRPFFDSITTKNFFVMVSAEFAPETDTDYTFSDICKITHESLSSQITKENLETILSYNVSNEQLFIARAVPLFLKNIAIKFIYTKSALANTTTITNIGNITLQDEYMPYVDNIYAMIAFSKGQELKGLISSFKGRLCFTISSAWQDTGIQRRIFSQIASDGGNVTIETNGVYDL